MTEDFLWVSKYAPQSIEECILPPSLKKEFSQLVETGQLGNMLFNGDAGVGKTTVAKVLCDVLNVDMMFMNASSERGIDEVRNKIQQFASTTALFGEYKVLLLDEADNLTSDAQKALRHLIEQYQNNCRFVLTANYPYKLIDPLRSRLQEYNFTFPSEGKTIKTQFTKRVLDILVKEEVQMSKKDLPIIQDLIDLYYPNWRKVIHQLQRICSSGKVDHGVVAKVKNEHISTLFEYMKTKNFTSVRNWMAENMASGVESADIVSLVYNNMKDFLEPASIPQCVLILADYQQKAAVVANQEVNNVAMAVEMMMSLQFK